MDINTYIPGKIICVGMNYRSHVVEQDGRFPSKPVLFSKATSCVIKDGESIIYPPQVEELDYEVELAAVIGIKMKDINPEDAVRYIYGYTIMNDITARDIQQNENQWYRAKSFDTFGPIGPMVASPEKIPDPGNVNLRSYVNGELRQDGNTGDMIFGVYELVSYISKSITLYPGDLVSTGTPSGVGVFSKGKKLLMPGDEVVCEIEGIGRLTNKVVSHAALQGRAT
ncbi:MAG: fumarylacetoacetate hydrolase family protein [Actinobacteria bacterium]|nr:fumarylacetoacetate hydrolase family protein [Actinomycetota bacterium]